MARIKRGDLWTADLRPGQGFEVSKKRPCLIVSNNAVNNISPTIVIIPLSSRAYKILGPERLFIAKKESRLAKDSVILVTQIRAIDKTRLIKPLSSISKAKLEEVEDAIKIVLDLTGENYLQ
jgi:mRNA interferase MazF